MGGIGRGLGSGTEALDSNKKILDWMVLAGSKECARLGIRVTSTRRWIRDCHLISCKGLGVAESLGVMAYVKKVVDWA